MEKTERDFMLLAINEASKSTERLKCGAVIVKDGKVILAVARNSARSDNDASAHAEVNAIRAAGRKIGSKYLDGCTIYCTCEPCVMCLSAILFSKIDKIVYGLTLFEVSPKEKNIDIPLNFFLARSPRKIKIVKNFMKEECKKLLI